MKAGNRYPATVSDIRERLADQWRKNRYAVTLDQANITLNQLSQDKGLLEKCAQFKVAITEVIWDMAVASARRHLQKGLTASRQQAKDTLKKARRRAPSDTISRDDNDEKRILVRGVRARYQIKTLTQTFARRKDILARYSNPPGKERDVPRLKPRGRRADTAGDWFIKRLMQQLSHLSPRDRNDLRSRILIWSGFLHPWQIGDPLRADDNAPETIKRRLQRINARQRTYPPTRSAPNLSDRLR